MIPALFAASIVTMTEQAEAFAFYAFAWTSAAILAGSTLYALFSKEPHP